MIPDLAGLLGLRGRPRWWQGRQAGPRRALDINQRARCQPATGFQALGGKLRKIGIERWVEENDVEGTPGAPEKAQRVAMLNLGAAGAPLGEARAQLPSRGPVALDEGNLRGSPREGFEAKRAAPSEEIEATRSRQARPQPVEERFTHPVRSGANFRRRRKAQLPTPPHATDDTKNPRLRRAALRGRAPLPSGFSPLLQRFTPSEGTVANYELPARPLLRPLQ